MLVKFFISGTKKFRLLKFTQQKGKPGEKAGRATTLGGNPKDFSVFGLSRPARRPNRTRPIHSK